ncbi:TonB-dependent receptor [Edaphobacter bradus]|uniref:TonB-dependent receptor n=1 Tax=Edaphobacter bradus TaxID=2259016 RepID=UPI0021E03EEE|nr:carboxypeptidase-like regulatory domain-containing protein [Edaphobacter bradus]
MTRIITTKIVLSLVATCVVAAPVSAQVRGELKGRISDPSGAAISGAQVTLTQTATGVRQNAATTDAGEYDFTQLNSGTYSIAVDRPSFARLQRNGITVTVGQTVNLDLALQPGPDNQTITVNADAPLLQTATSDIATTIAGSTVVALPLNSRNFVQLSTLAPGVALPPGTLLPRINGGRPRTNEYLYDGISALQPEPGQVAFFPIIDDIAEFTIEANNVPAEFGRFNGGVVNVATRSGNNQFHGSLYEFFRNEALNSRNYFAGSAARKPEYRRNLYGGTIGGPILHDRLFFFGDYQGIKQRIGVTRISTVPTLAERRGIFTGVAKIYDPTTTQVVNGKVIRTEFPNDVIDKPLDPAAVALLARYPLPTSGGAANNFTRTANDDDHQNQFDLRIDAAHGSRDRGFARYTYYNEVEQPVTPLPEGSGAIGGSVIGTGNVGGLSNILGQQIVLSETHTFSPSVVNDVRLGYTRRGNTQSGPTLSSTASDALGIPGIPTNASFNNVLPLFTLTGFQQLGANASTSARYQTSVSELIDTVLFTHAAHSLKAGADMRRYELNAISPPNPTGSFSFTNTGTNTTGAKGSTGGNALAGFLLGQVDTFSIDLQNRTIRPRDYIYEFFAQDDWRISPRLTLNIGARWTLHLPSTETRNQGAVFNLATQQLDYLGVNGYPRTARELHWANVAPRLGFTFAVDPKTVLRTGFGIVFIDQSGITTPFTTPQYPFIQNVQQKTTDGFVPAFQLSKGPTVTPIPLTPDAGLGQSVYTANRKAGSGYVQQWNLAVQRSITNNLSVEIAYVGSHIVHVGIPDANLNQLTAAQLATGLTNPTALTAQVTNPYYGLIPPSSSIGGPKVAAAQLLKPYPRFQNVAIYRNNSGTTNYNAIEAKAEQRLSHGLSFLFSYTHSKLIDDASSVFSSTVLSSPNSSSLIAADTYRPYLERDSSNGDMPNVFAISGVYELPRYAGHGLATKAFGGWTLNAIVSLQSGMPVTVTQATNLNSFAGVVLRRPNLTANPALSPGQRTPAHFFNTAAFATAPEFTFGNASRNPVRGPAYRNADFALVKHTRIGERTDVELRAELFNVTNTPAFSQPNGSFGAAAFGSITSTTTDPRVAQFAVKLSR